MGRERWVMEGLEVPTWARKLETRPGKKKAEKKASKAQSQHHRPSVNKSSKLV